MFDAGVASLGELTELPKMLALQSLNLHCNRVQQISHLEPLTQLQSLNLSSNLIEAMCGMHALTHLRSLDLSCNRIRLIDGLATLRNLSRLLLSFNRINSLAGMVQCHGSALEHFEAYGNRVALLREAEYLRGLPRLTEVVLRRHGQDNPMCREAAYRERVVALLPTLHVLDDAVTATGDAALQNARHPALPLSAMLSEAGVHALGEAERATESAAMGSGAGLSSKIDSVATMVSAAAAAGRPDGAAAAGRSDRVVPAGRTESAAAAKTISRPVRDAASSAGVSASGAEPSAASVVANLPPTPHIDRTFEALRARRQSDANTDGIGSQRSGAERGKSCGGGEGDGGGDGGGGGDGDRSRARAEGDTTAASSVGSGQEAALLQSLSHEIRLERLETTLGLHAVQSAVEKAVEKARSPTEGNGDGEEGASEEEEAAARGGASRRTSDAISALHPVGDAASSIVVPDISDDWPTGGARRRGRETRRSDAFPEPPPHRDLRPVTQTQTGRSSSGRSRALRSEAAAPASEDDDRYEQELAEMGRAAAAAAAEVAAGLELSPQEWEAEYDYDDAYEQYEAEEPEGDDDDVMDEPMATTSCGGSSADAADAAGVEAYRDLGDSVSARGGRGTAVRRPPPRQRRPAPSSAPAHGRTYALPALPSMEQSESGSLTASSLADHERTSVRQELDRLRAKLQQTEADVGRLVEQAAASEHGRVTAVANEDALTQRLAQTERQLASVQTELGASTSASAALVNERDSARAEGQQALGLAQEAHAKGARLESELATCKRELDRSAHAVSLAAKREAHAREALAELGDLSARRLHEAGATASEDAAKHAALQEEMCVVRAEVASANATIASLEAAASHAVQQEEARTSELANLREQAAAQAVALRAEHAKSMDALRSDLEKGYAAREEELKARLDAAETRAAEARQREARHALHEADESVHSLANLRQQLLAAVAKEVSARGAAQEMAGLLKEQQSKLSALAEARHELHSELASLKASAAEELREAKEAARQAGVAQQAEAAGAHAALTREQLALASAKEERAGLERRVGEELAKRDKEHADAMRLKQVMLDDLSAQVTTARQAAERAQDAASQAANARDTALRDAANGRDAHEALRATEETIERLESALEELEHGRDEARAEADTSRQECRHKEEMLEFVEKEVRASSQGRRHSEAPCLLPLTRVLQWRMAGALRQGLVLREGAVDPRRCAPARSRPGGRDPPGTAGTGRRGGRGGASSESRGGRRAITPRGRAGPLGFACGA